MSIIHGFSFGNVLFWMCRPISPEEKIAITLRFLATGVTFHSLIYQFRVHRVSMGKFVPEVCKVIYH